MSTRKSRLSCTLNKDGHPYKMSFESRLKISLGRLNSPTIQAMKEETKRRNELKRQARALEVHQQREIWGNYHSPETRAKISAALKDRFKGRTPWNKGVKAWNNGMKWPDEVRQNISRGMIVYWSNRKKEEQPQKQ